MEYQWKCPQVRGHPLPPSFPWLEFVLRPEPEQPFWAVKPCVWECEAVRRVWVFENHAAAISHLPCFPGGFGNFESVWVTDILGVLSLQPDLKPMNGRMEGRSQVLRTLLSLSGDRAVRRESQGRLRGPVGSGGILHSACVGPLPCLLRGCTGEWPALCGRLTVRRDRRAPEGLCWRKGSPSPRSC